MSKTDGTRPHLLLRLLSFALLATILVLLFHILGSSCTSLGCDVSPLLLLAADVVLGILFLTNILLAEEQAIFRWIVAFFLFTALLELGLAGVGNSIGDRNYVVLTIEKLTGKTVNVRKPPDSFLISIGYLLSPAPLLVPDLFIFVPALNNRLRKANRMRIGIIGWGSLIWDPRELPREGVWQDGGPRLPVEFSRVSQDCRLTLVIDYETPDSVETKYVLSPRVDLDQAIEDLRHREGTNKRWIGYVDKKHKSDSGQLYEPHRRACNDIREWLDRTDFDAVVWTALPSNYRGETGREFSVPTAVDYIQGLPQTSRDQALRYIVNAPIDTPLRRRLREIGLIQE
jgi:hypothetical protein